MNVSQAGNPAAQPRRIPFSIAMLPYVALHLGCLGVFATGFTRTGLAIGGVTFLARMFFMTAGYHRYFAHRSYKTSRWFQFLLGLGGTMGLQRGVLWWAQTHRYHHRHADTELDLHSPHFQGFWYSHCGWFFHADHRETDHSAVPDLAKFPELVWLDGDLPCILVPTVTGLALALLYGWEGVVWGVCVSTVAVWQITHWVQSFSHSWRGYRRFATKDETRNHWLLGVLSLGEFHNNHHASPGSAKQGVSWWELDICYGILKLLSWTGLIWDLRAAQRHTLEQPEESVQLSGAPSNPRA